MSALVYNTLDRSFLTTGNPAPHVAYSVPAPAAGALSISTNSANQPEDRSDLVITMPAGFTPSDSGVFRGVAWLKPSPDRASSNNPDYIAVTPGEPMSVSMNVFVSGAWSGVTREFRAILAFQTTSGDVISSGNIITAGYRGSTGGGNAAKTAVTTTVPDNATSAYVLLAYRYPNTNPAAGERSIYIRNIFAGDPRLHSGATDISAATDARLGIVSDIYSRSREKIKLVLATPDENLVSGRRVELSAAAYTATPVVWRWRQITGPAVDLEPWGNNVDFVAPDVGEPTALRIGVYAISEDGRNRSDWHYFDLEILPPVGRFLAEGGAEYVPTVPSVVGYGRGRREVWNDVVRPPHFWANPRNEVEVVDLGITPDDVQFSAEPPESCAAGGIYINPETGDVFRNFGAGYNETDDKTGAPRTNAYWLNPATGDILEWRGA